MLPTDPNEHIEKAREILAMVLREASKFAPQRSLLIVHLGTEVALRKHCCLPPWLEVAHHGAVSGLDKWGAVRAAFVVGLMMPPAELITRQAEAISGEYIAQRSDVGCEEITTRSKELSLCRASSTHILLDSDCYGVRCGVACCRRSGERATSHVPLMTHSISG